MLFNSAEYIFLFLPCAIAVYFLLHRWRFASAASAWLVLASLLFYGHSNVSHLLIIISSISVNFFFSTLLRQINKKSSAAACSIIRAAILPLGIVFNLGLLGWYKYADFFVINVNNLFGCLLPLPHIALPLAVSFFTFQQIAYLVECSKRNATQYNFLDYCLFVSFFPQLLAGPISHYHETMPQFSRIRNWIFSSRNAALGIFFFSAGLFKKVWVADQFAVWANVGFASSPGALTFFDAWGASLSYTFQLYFDFSGYTDMAIGSALFFNIVLPVNFDSPYQSASIQEFWRRWHITLSRWLREYLYIPLGGNRKGQLRTCLHLLITFMLAGLWHGAGWTFVIWGLLHGMALVAHRLWKEWGLRMPVFLGWLCTFLFVNVSWVIFRAGNMAEGLRVLKGMAGLNGITFSAGMVQLVETISPLRGQLAAGTLLLPGQMRWHLLAFGLVLFLLPNSCQIGGLLKKKVLYAEPQIGKVRPIVHSVGQLLFRFRPNCYWAALTGIMFSMALYSLLRVAPSKFLYFNF